MTKYYQNKNSISGRIDDELVIMDIEKGEYFSLNSVTTRIWDLLENPISIEKICSVLLEEYEVEESQCREEVKEVVEEMVRLGVVLRQEA